MRLRLGSVTSVTAVLAALGLGLGSCASPGAASLELVRDERGAPVALEARGLNAAGLQRASAAGARWSEALQVFVDERGWGPVEGAPPVLGSVDRQGDVLRFEPRYPLEPGLSYRARLRPGPWLPGGSGSGNGAPPLEAVFALPAPRREPSTIVEQVYPGAAVLPENQLKFYIHFSAPMRRGQAYDRVRLLDAAGAPVDAPFLELGEELWDPGGTRFTLFFDPGRIKRGLLPHDEVGPCLERGKRYTLLVDAGWLDARGAPLRREHRKRFAVGPPDYEQPDPRRWTIAAPAAGSVAPLVVSFPEPLDHALAERLLRIRGPDGAEVAGAPALADEERQWRFAPGVPWQAGRHQLVFERILEDLAGNSVDRPFEVDVSRGIESRIVPATEAIDFEIEPAISGPR